MTATGVIAPVVLPSSADRATAHAGVVSLAREPLPLPDLLGYAVARAYAGHTDSSNHGTTATYIRADVHEVAAALAALTGEPHPLADPTHR